MANSKNATPSLRNNGMRSRSATTFIIVGAESASGAKKVLECEPSTKSLFQLFDPDSVFSKKHLILAYENAAAAFKNRTNRSRSMSTEMLLFASAQRQISEAIRLSGAKDGSRFIIFTDSAAAFDRAVPLLSHIKPVGGKEYGGRAAIKRLGLEGTELADLAQAMALSGMQ